MSSLFTYLSNKITSSNGQLDAALENLADISVGQTPSMWPLAWGWWVLIALITVLLAIIIWQAIEFVRKRKVKRRALKAIANIEEHDVKSLQKLHAILRSAIIHYFPSENISGIQGHVWQTFLHERMSPSLKANSDVVAQLNALETSLYTKSPSISTNEAKEAVSLCIKHSLPPAKSASAPSQNETEQGVQHV
ncbi:MAG: hypothetical protein ACI9O6_003210 [Glaciecola sp.]|jgi:hypothetical protein